jgi:hypothetical protein
MVWTLVGAFDEDDEEEDEDADIERRQGSAPVRRETTWSRRTTRQLRPGARNFGVGRNGTCPTVARRHGAGGVETMPWLTCASYRGIAMSEFWVVKIRSL